jgi:hypothetical protein
MWTEITRRKYEREGQRYASDLTDAEWALIEHMPAVKRLGRPRETEVRSVLDAILYIARTGCQWRILPKVQKSVMPEAIVNHISSGERPKAQSLLVGGLRLRRDGRDAPMPTIRALSPGVAAPAYPRKLTLLR